MGRSSGYYVRVVLSNHSKTATLEGIRHLCDELVGAPDLVRCSGMMFEYALETGAAWIALWEKEGENYRLVGARSENDDMAGAPARPGMFPDGSLELQLGRSSKALGLLGIGPRQDGRDWSAEDKDGWRILSDYIALVWATITLDFDLETTRRQLGRRELDLGTLFGIAQELNSSLSTRTIAQTLLFSAMGHCASRAGLVSCNLDGKQTVLAQQGLTMEHSLSGPLNEAMAGKAFPHDSDDIAPWGLFVPIRHGGDTIGVMALERKLTGRPFSKEEINFLQAMAEQAAIALSNAGYCEELQETLERERRSFSEREKMSRYLSAGAMAEVAGSGDSVALGGRTVNATILFADVRGFTSLSEQIPPQEVVSLLNAYMTQMASLIGEFGGILDKFMGDGIMAIFKPTDETDNDAYRAVACAVKMRREVDRMNAEGAFPNGHRLCTGIGINSGEVVAGNIGSKDRMDYTVIGDNVNLAARLESTAKPGQILLSKATFERLGGLVATKYMDTIVLKGKSVPLDVYQVPA